MRANRVLAALLAVSGLAIAVDGNTTLLREVRFALWTVASPLHFVSAFAESTASNFMRTFADQDALRRENKKLKQEILTLRGVLTRHDAVLAENAKLRDLYDSRERSREHMLVAELVAISENPLTITIDKGRLGELRVGHTVIDSSGLLGQIVETSAFTSRVLLITDSSHSVPVRALRNDVRAIATGDGKDGLVLKDIPATLDIRTGDHLVTSGLGGRFPPGYPVGEVDSVVVQGDAPFARATVRPAAALDRSRQVLVVQGEESEQFPPTPPAAVTEVVD